MNVDYWDIEDPLPPKFMTTLCGVARRDTDSSTYSYRCTKCHAVIGSIGMPSARKKLYDMKKVVDKLKDVS